MIKNCYIHIPFCNTICSYCDFCKQFYDKKKVNIYLFKLKEEVFNNYKNELLDTIYIGGGTPTSLDILELKELFSITDNLNKNNNIEFTMEANYESITKEKLDLMVSHGVNRISIGLESTNKDNLKFLNREFNRDKFTNTIKMIRDVGINNINIDLIYGLPIENMDILKADLDYIISLNVEHISTYSLIIEDHTILGINNTSSIDEELDKEMYEFIISYLKKHNYKHYEISNFCKDNYYSRHNMCYWNNLEYYGFGLGAASYIDNIRKTNTRSINNYPYKYLEVEELDINEKIEYEILLNLRLIDGIDLNVFKSKYNIDLKDVYDYSELVNNKLLILKDSHLRIPEEYLYVSNEIIVKFLQTRKD